MPDTQPQAHTLDTRDRLLTAALHAFGRRDYDGVSTREIVPETIVVTMIAIPTSV